MSATGKDGGELSQQQREQLLSALQARFQKNVNRHQGLDWAGVQTRLKASPAKLWSLNEMERTGGEPDVTGQDARTGEYIFYDCAEQTPPGRRKACYDREAAEERAAPGGNVIDLAAALGIDLLTEEQYRGLQRLGEFDTKTESWIKTPADIRRLGGALFAHRRYGHVFVFHNSAPSWYSGRGFRGALRV